MKTGGNGAKGKEPVSIFSLLLLILMIIIVVFLVLVQNVDRFSDYFGGTTYKIIFDAALLVGVVLFAVYIFNRNASYHRSLEALVNQLERSNALLQTINAIQERANATLEAQALLQEVLEMAMPAVSSRGTIFLLDEDSGHFRAVAGYGMDMDAGRIPHFAPGEGIVGRVARSGEPLEDGGTGEGVGPARIALPIKTQNKVMGVMVVGSGKGGFSDEERTLLYAVTEVLGNSLTNAKLFDLTRRALETTRKTQAYLEGFIRESGLGVLVVDERGTGLIANREAERFLSAARSSFLGPGTLENLVLMGDRGGRLAEALRSCLRNGKSISYSQAGAEDPLEIYKINVFALYRGKSDILGAAASISRS